MFRTAILDTDLTEDELVGAIDDALFAAAQQGTAPLAYQYSENPSDEELVHVWQGGHEGDVLRIVEDGPMECVYAVARSADAGFADAMIEALRKNPGIRGCAAVVAEVRDSYSDDPDGLMRLTVCDSKNHDTASEKLLLEASRSEDEDVRLVAAQAMGVLSWPALLSRLREMEPAETDEAIRDIIAFALKPSRN